MSRMNPQNSLTEFNAAGKTLRLAKTVGLFLALVVLITPIRASESNTTPGTKILINGRELTKEQVIALAQAYHYFPPPGRYWYDTRSGAWGVEGHETAGFILTGHDFGPMAATASKGNTGVFINGREMNMIEAVRIYQTFGAVYRGQWWLDGRTGYYGVEGNPMPVGNIVMALRSQRSGRGGDNFWCSVTACGNDNGKSGYVDVGGTIVGYDH
jgi:hypothetical protein